MKNVNHTIKCDFENCKYNDDTKYLCKLDEIVVSCTCNKNDCNDKNETICSSFKEKEN